MSRTEVLIVGAGPTGLILALWLTKAGVPVRIIDKTAEPGTTSRALAVQARTLELYRQLGVADDVAEAGFKVSAVNAWSGGTRAARLPFEDMGWGLSPFPYVLVLPQDEHEKLLITHLEALGVHVERRTELVRFAKRTDGIQATLHLSDGSEEQCDATYLAGCDGAHSQVREALGIGFPGGTYDELFYVADVEASGPMVSRELYGSVDGTDFVVVFPLHEDKQVRLIGRVRQASGDNPHALTFDDVSRHAIDHMRIAVSRVNWFSTYRVHHRVANSFRDGRVFLLGDAAHIHSPVGGQGMNTGIGDAVNLAWKLAAVVRSEATARLLDSYEPERIAFARRLVATTDRAFTFVTSQHLFVATMRSFMVAAILPLALKEQRLRRTIFRTISQIGIEYRDSFLSAGAAGKVKAGDRLPWVPMRDTDNFAPLASMAWQVHVYGELRVSAKITCAELRVPLHVFAWTPEAKRAGLARSAFYLIRPDGYVALADRHGGGYGLRPYLVQRGLSLSAD